MKLLYITTTINGAGGLQRVLVDKANTFASMGYEVAVLCTNPSSEPSLYPLLPQVGLAIIRPKKGLNYFFSYKKLLLKHIKAFRPDILIMCDNGIKSFLLPYFTPRRYKLVYEMHGSKNIWLAFIRPYFLRAMLYRFMDVSVSRYDRLVVLSPSARKEWNCSNADIIPNYLWFNETGKSSLMAKKAIAVGRHVPEKGYDRLLLAWKSVTEKYPEWVLEIYGEENPDYDLREMANRLGISNHVVFHEPRPDIHKAYITASVCLVASYSEGFGMVLLEAMACGVPCVAFDCPVGPADIIVDRQNGLLVPEGNLELYIKAVLEIIENENLRHYLGSKASEIKDRYSKAASVARWNKLFTSLAGR
ncbi:hypothetical protein CHU92_13995 [Flavobacterium cyanobacteriorum]|uniref:Group 1 glycosyl transferase n=1 Tax=Flavobacterium cyanobacteriorum TaxID=2022802 RepID=A0A255YUW9_9FLAO|nr:glycosyltransferase family 4 protein [Flavobacterium cyanobacteriorum]OYQ33027.1 hypothetical protein CHU92_13995 [Flavobacterium cyanobacteriorum]